MAIASDQAARGCVLAAMIVVAAAAIAAGRACAQADELGVAPVALRDEPYVFDTAEQHRIRVSVIARGLDHPFGLAFLPNGDALVSERGKQLRLIRNAANESSALLESEPIAGTPLPGSVRPTIGLLDVAVHPEFGLNRFVYFTQNKVRDGDPRTMPPPDRETAFVLTRGVFDGEALTKVEDVYVAPFAKSTSWASRIAFSDGFVYLSTPAPLVAESAPGAAVDITAQSLASPYGKVLRLNHDGSVPDDNPFVGRPTARPEVFSIGHRDHHGLVVHPLTGAVLNAEHGPNGGDEVNLILPGRNYGWPTHSFGRTYEGERLTPSPVGDGIETPLIVWLPSIAPSGLAVYVGNRFPAWKGNLFVSSMRIGQIPRTGGLERVVVNDDLGELRRERLLIELRQRVVNVKQGPDELLYVLTDQLSGDSGALLRIEPAQ